MGQSVCLNTIIDDWNMNAFMDDKEKLMTKAITKAARLKKYLIGKSVDEIADDGVIPGNNLGGGGLDTVFWSHLKRNWSHNSNYDMKVETLLKKKRRSSNYVVPKLKR